MVSKYLTSKHLLIVKEKESAWGLTDPTLPKRSQCTPTGTDRSHCAHLPGHDERTSTTDIPAETHSLNLSTWGSFYRQSAFTVTSSNSNTSTARNVSGLRRRQGHDDKQNAQTRAGSFRCKRVTTGAAARSLRTTRRTVLIFQGSRVVKQESGFLGNT